MREKQVQTQVPDTAPADTRPGFMAGSLSSPTVLLAWALDREGRRVHVAHLDGARRRTLAPFACPGCGEEVVPKLGPERARHFAHRPGSTCPLTRPETLLHMRVKERLLFLCREAFAGSTQVLLRARCPVCRRETPLGVAALADAVAAEGAVGGIRADVLLSRGGTPALALEVRVTHEVDARKEAALANLALPAFEIDARAAWEEEVPGGVAVRVARTLGASPCASCRIVARADVARDLGGEEALVAELEAYRARGLFEPRPGNPLASCPPLSSSERGRIAASFRCPECKTTTLSLGTRLVRHACACAGAPDRPVAWRGYDGALVELSWWRRS